MSQNIPSLLSIILPLPKNALYISRRFFPKTAVVIDDLTTVVSLNLLLHSFVAAAAATRVDNIDSGPFQCLVFVFFGFFLFSFCLFACLFYFFLIVFNLVVSFWQKEIQVITGKISFSLRITIIV